MFFFIFSLLINFVKNNDEEYWKGFLYAALLFLSAFLQTLITAQYSHRMYLTAMRVRTALVSAVYRKALLMSNASKKGDAKNKVT